MLLYLRINIFIKAGSTKYNKPKFYSGPELLYIPDTFSQVKTMAPLYGNTMSSPIIFTLRTTIQTLLGDDTSSLWAIDQDNYMGTSS